MLTAVAKILNQKDIEVSLPMILGFEAALKIYSNLEDKMSKKITLNNAALEIHGPLGDYFQEADHSILLGKGDCEKGAFMHATQAELKFMPQVQTSGYSKDKKIIQLIGKPGFTLNDMERHIAAELGYLSFKPNYKQLEALRKCYRWEYSCQPVYLRCFARLTTKGSKTAFDILIPVDAGERLVAEPVCCKDEPSIAHIPSDNYPGPNRKSDDWIHEALRKAKKDKEEDENFDPFDGSHEEESKKSEEKGAKDTDAEFDVEFEFNPPWGLKNWPKLTPYDYEYEDDQDGEKAPEIFRIPPRFKW